MSCRCKRRVEIEEFGNASDSPDYGGACRRRRDMRSGGLPIDVDIRILQAGKLRDGGLFLFVRPLNRAAERSHDMEASRSADALRIKLGGNPPLTPMTTNGSRTRAAR